MWIRIFGSIVAICCVLAVPAPARATTEIPKYSDVKIPPIETVVENFSIYVKLPNNWNVPEPYEVVYQLEGWDSKSEKWIQIFGTGPEGHAAIDLPVPAGTPKVAQSVRLDVVVPKFSANTAIVKYRLLFGVNVKKGENPYYHNLGAIALKYKSSDGDHKSFDNSGSLPGHTFTLSWANQNQIYDLFPDSGGVDALKLPTHPPKLIVEGDKHALMVWSDKDKKYKRFFVRGMAYEVTPVGQLMPSTVTPDIPTCETPFPKNTECLYLAEFNKMHGGQICEPLPGGPYGTQHQSYCFDTDLTGKMHSYLNNATLKGTSKPNALLEKLWDRDFKMLHAMGVNVIRIYHIDALVRNMTGFLDMAHERGIYVIMPAPAEAGTQTFSSSPSTGLLPDWSQMQNSKNGMPWSALMQLALARYAAHPAILAWAVGNETNADNGNLHAAKVEWVLAKTIKKLSDKILVTSTNQDHYNDQSNFKKYYEVFQKYTKGTESYLDFYSINSYRGVAPNQLKVSALQTLFNIHGKLESPYDLPLLISEWGKYDTYDWGAFDNQWGIARMWRMILTTSSDVLGLSYFEFSDEPIAKVSQKTQLYMGVVAFALPQDFKKGGAMAIDEIRPKFKDYKGIAVPKDTATYQNYPAVRQAGIFDSFIGDNKNTLTRDAAIAQVPNISYCAFRMSTAPWHINKKCLKLDVKPKNTQSPFEIVVTPAGNETIASMEFNGKSYKSAGSLTKTGILTVKVEGTNGGSAFVSAGFDELGSKPATNDNTLLYRGFKNDAPPSFNWSGKSKLTIALPPVGGS